MTKIQDFSQRLIDLHEKLAAFHVDFSQGDNVDFSVIYQDVHDFITQASHVRLTAKEKTLLTQLSDRLVSIFNEIEQELQVTKAQIFQNETQKKGLKAYVRHQYMGEVDGSSELG